MGSLFKQKWTKNGETRESRKWYGEFRDESGLIRRVPLSADKQSARSLLLEFEKKVERLKAGLIDEHTESARLPIQGLVEDYLADLRLRGRSARHLQDTGRLLWIVLKACDFATVGSLNSAKLDRLLAAMTCSARTKTTHRQAIMGFANWCVRKGRLEFNPLARSTRPEGETVLKRRALAVDELKRLLEQARTRSLRDRLIVRTGPNRGKALVRLRPEVHEKLERRGRERALIYKAAYYTGLRRGELRQLRVYHLTLDRVRPRLQLPGEFTKNGRDANLPLREDFAEELTSWIEETGRRPGEYLFDVPDRIAQLMKKDLESAGIPYKDERGRVADFHSLRKCLATHLNKEGVPIVTAKEFLRHGTIELTAGVYNDSDSHDLRAALGKLPIL